MNRRPHRRDSTAWRMLEYFLANPDEELTVADAEIKFGVKYQQVYRAIQNTPHEIEHVNVIRLRKRPE